MRIFATLIAIISIIVTAQAQSIGRAPLGLEWGLSQEETKKLGVELTTQSDDSYGKAVVFTKLPQTIADADTVLGSYGYDDRLYRIVILSKQFPNDPYGNAVLARYSSLGAILSEKYGRAAQTHQKGDSIYAEQRYFISGIQGGEDLLVFELFCAGPSYPTRNCCRRQLNRSLANYLRKQGAHRFF